MARRPRVDFPGAFHHVMNRGAALQDTFRNDSDRHRFLRLWAEAVSRFGIEVIAFCLMGNHYHVFVHSPDGQLSESMKFVAQSYTQEFNQAHDRDGALFRGRFHSILIDSTLYFLRVARYIERNPVAAGLCTVEELLTNPWSSLRYYTGVSRPPEWLSTHHLTSRIEPDAYRTFVDPKLPDTLINRFYERPMSPGRVLGDSTFVETTTADHPELSEVLSPGIGLITAEQVDAAVITISGVDPSELRRPRGGGKYSPARLVAMELAALLTAELRCDLAKRYGYASRQGFDKAIHAGARATSSEVKWLREATLGVLLR